MLRLAPNGYYRFFQNDQMQATFGGGEANVAVSLANYGLESVYVTKLPKHAIGEAAVSSLRYFGVDTSKVVRGGDRVGIYGFSLDMDATHLNGVYHEGPMGTCYVDIDKLYATAPPISGPIDYSKKYEPVDFHDEPLAPNWI